MDCEGIVEFVDFMNWVGRVELLGVELSLLAFLPFGFSWVVGIEGNFVGRKLPSCAETGICPGKGMFVPEFAAIVFAVAVTVGKGKVSRASVAVASSFVASVPLKCSRVASSGGK